MIPAIDECTSAPCKNGADCVDLVDMYDCECLPGYGGANCQTCEYGVHTVRIS